MARRYTLKAFNVGGDKAEIADAVGKQLNIHRITRTVSRQYGDGVEILADLVDPSTGEVLGTMNRYVTFSGPIVRDLGQVLGDVDTWDMGDDSLNVLVNAAGQAYVLEDAPVKEGEALVGEALVAARTAEPFPAEAMRPGESNPPTLPNPATQPNPAS